VISTNSTRPLGRCLDPRSDSYSPRSLLIFSVTEGVPNPWDEIVPLAVRQGAKPLSPAALHELTAAQAELSKTLSDQILDGQAHGAPPPLGCRASPMRRHARRFDASRYVYRGWLRTGSTDMPSDNCRLFNIAGMARAKRGQGAMWSSAIAEKVEAFRQKQ